MIAFLDCATCNIAVHFPGDYAGTFIKNHRAHALTSVTLVEAEKEEELDDGTEERAAVQVWERKLEHTCPGCGQKNVESGRCILCGRKKTGDEVFVGKVRIR